ncbi:MAG TPA: diguanylate cyclase, partial [Lysobacter sp.]|nr:diguanylate cyclase [Lysobacter sp.]
MQRLRAMMAAPSDQVDHSGHALASALRQGLPAGSQVLVRWRDHVGSPGFSLTDAVPVRLTHLAEQLMLSGAAASEDLHTLAVAWDGDGDLRAVIVAQVHESLAPAARRGWLAMAQLLVAAHLSAVEAQARAELLEKSERLQQALYEIADLAGSDLEMADMLRRIHAVVAGLMYAENFYIVLYDDVHDSLRFLYFADRRDPYVADPSLEIAAVDISNSMTLALLRHGEPLRGPSDELRAQFGVMRDIVHGPDSEDWLGVPMRRDDRVCGAVVVQSYDRPGVYRDEERALLSYVAQHILTALDRRQARDELELRVEERTRALQHSNRDLQAEIVERQRGERLQRALFRIAELSITSETLERFYTQVHDVVGELLYARNFYIALVSEDGMMIEFPYSIDERDVTRQTRQFARGLTEYVISEGRALLADRSVIQNLENQGKVRSLGTLAHCWLGVPLFRDEMVVGVIAVQSYSPAISFTTRDQELLTFVAHHIGAGLARKQAQDRLLLAHGELEQRVTSRTRELAEANAELLSQIGERLRAEQQLTYQARHDALTGLPNRSQLLERLSAAIARAQAETLQGHAPRQFAVLFLDLDRFKLVNDSVGHSAGDDLLIEAGRRIVATVRGGDTVARLGGDEFAILITDVEGLHIAEDLARRVLVALGEPFWVAGREVFPSASVGIAAWNPRYQNGAELLRDADAAMYRAKASGRSGCAVFDEAMREEAM